MRSVKDMLEAVAKRRGVTPQAMKGFVAGITLMSYGPNITDEQFEQCLDLLVLKTDEVLLDEALGAAMEDVDKDE